MGLAWDLFDGWFAGGAAVPGGLGASPFELSGGYWNHGLGCASMSEQFEDVVAKGDEVPFRVDRGQSSKREASKALGVLDLQRTLGAGVGVSAGGGFHALGLLAKIGGTLRPRARFQGLLGLLDARQTLLAPSEFLGQLALAVTWPVLGILGRVGRSACRSRRSTSSRRRTSSWHMRS